jgi:hypothetical protein
MNKKNKYIAILTVGFLIGPLTAQAQYDYQQIGYPGQAQSSAWGINDSGDAVVHGFDPDNIPFVYSAMDGTITDVAPAAGYLFTTLLAINDAGVMAGTVASLDDTTSSGVIRSKKGEYTVFDHPDALTNTSVRGINNKGLVTGTRDTVDNSIAGFLYDPKTETFTDLVPSAFTIPHGINSKGVVVGDARFEVDPCGGPNPVERYGWVRATDGSVVLFQVNGQRTVARGINDAGMIAGNTVDPVTFQLKGYVIKAPKTNCESISVDASELLQFPGSDITFPEGITNSGDIVGIFFDAAGNNHGFIATPQ